LWPLAAVVLLYVIYRVFNAYPELLAYIAALIGIFAIAMGFVGCIWFDTTDCLRMSTLGEQHLVKVKNPKAPAVTREIAGVQNILVPGYTHMGIMESPAVQERILSGVE
jgi:hypothetical protein